MRALKAVKYSFILAAPGGGGVAVAAAVGGGTASAASQRKNRSLNIPMIKLFYNIFGSYF
ncbi:hypothetical protein HanIR_Chr12g0587731 [Helianthus annuus]|nr:hypothetical protein HanIR_Chr12g0587731 [Helianthus annuus]